MYQTVEKQAGAVKDIGNHQFKSNIAKWAINKKNSKGQKIFLYAFITSDAQAQGKGGGVKITRTACFVAGTKVWLHNHHQINIEDVQPNDTVRAFDVYAQREVLGIVTYTMVKQASSLIGVYTTTDTLWVTPEHPFYINGEWIPAGRLKKGQRLTLLNRSNSLASRSSHLSHIEDVYIDSIATKDTLVTVYNFTVEKYHNYYVGNVGVLTHNKLCEVKRATDRTKNLEYIVFRDDESGSIHIKIDGGEKKANGDPKLISLGNGSIADGVNKKPKGKFSVTLKLKKKVDGKMVYKHPSIRGNFVLKTILDTEIKDYKKELKFFEANWSTGLPDNLNAFNNGIAGGMSKVEAANNTWSGDWFWENYNLACVSENDITIKGTTKLPNGNQKITSVSVLFKKSPKREIGIYVAKSSTVKYKGEQKWIAYYSYKKKSKLGEGIYHKKLQALQIEIFESGKRKEKKICDALLRKIKKGLNDKINVVFTTNKRDFQKLNLSEQLAKRRYLNNTIIKEFREKVKKSRLSITDWATKNGFIHIYLGRDLKGNLQIHYLKYDNFTPRTLIHYTNKKAYEGILSSKVLFPSLKKGSTKFGAGQYFTDIFPSDIGGYSTADLKQSTDGKKAAQQMALVLWGAKTRTRFMTHYVEIDVAGLKLKRNTAKGGYFVYKYPSTGNLNIKDRLISKGLTPYCSAYITKKIQGKEEIWELKATKQDSKPQIVATYIKTGKNSGKGALTIKRIKFSPGEKNAKKSWNLKKEWLTQLFNAVKSDQASENSSSSTQVNRDISVIVAMPNAGVDLNKFNAIKDSPQNKIDAEGQETLVGSWAANISIGEKKHEYKYTIIRKTQLRFSKTACFVAGTKVWLHNYKQINIEDIRSQDLVRAFDPATGKEVIGKVSQTMIKKASTLIKVYTMVDTFLVTPEHPFYIEGQWIDAGRLKKGYKLALLNHTKLRASITKPSPNEVFIDSIAVQDTLITVYNFTVAKYHNYYVGNVGTLVHNSNACMTGVEGLALWARKVWDNQKISNTKNRVWISWVFNDDGNSMGKYEFDNNKVPYFRHLPYLVNDKADDDHSGTHAEENFIKEFSGLMGDYIAYKKKATGQASISIDQVQILIKRSPCHNVAKRNKQGHNTCTQELIKLVKAYPNIHFEIYYVDLYYGHRQKEFDNSQDGVDLLTNSGIKNDYFINVIPRKTKFKKLFDDYLNRMQSEN